MDLLGPAAVDEDTLRAMVAHLLGEPVEDDRIEDAWISVPGFGGVEIIS